MCVRFNLALMQPACINCSAGPDGFHFTSDALRIPATLAWSTAKQRLLMDSEWKFQKQSEQGSVNLSKARGRYSHETTRIEITPLSPPGVD